MMKQMLVVGGANVDLVGIPEQQLRMRDSNPGKIRVSFGGVGRNIAHNAVLAGADVELATLFGDDLLGRSCYEDCVRIGIGMKHSRFSATHASSTYMAILDVEKDMQMAINDMAILEELDARAIQPAVLALDASDICVLDTNLNVEVLERLSGGGACVFALDPISTHKAVKAKAILHRFDIVKPNRQQAEILLDMKIETDQQLSKALDRFLEIGNQEIIISLGEQGIAATNGKEFVKLRMIAETVVNATGAGDCLLACYLAERLRNDDFIACLSYALAASVLTIGSEETVVQTLSDSVIRDHLAHAAIERSNLK
jgi:pseudouridine kinase